MWVISTDCLSASDGSGNSHGFKETGYLRWVVFCVNPGFFLNPCGREEGGQRPLYAAGVFAEWLCCFSPQERLETGEREARRRRTRKSSLRWAPSWGTCEGWRTMPCQGGKAGELRGPKGPQQIQEGTLEDCNGRKMLVWLLEGKTGWHQGSTFLPCLGWTLKPCFPPQLKDAAWSPYMPRHWPWVCLPWV